VGAAPGNSYADKTELYGIGAFLAAGTEVYKLVGGQTPAVGAEVHTQAAVCAPFAKQVSTAGITPFMKDGGWCWYQDPRVIIKNGKLIIGAEKWNSRH
jgi:hypothetical protein